MNEPNQSSDPQRDPVTDDLPATASEQELDDLLAHASELADDLSESVGAPDRTPGAPQADPPPDTDDEASNNTDLDEELARLEAQANEAANEIGQVEPSESTAPAGKANNPSSDSTGQMQDSASSGKGETSAAPSPANVQQKDVPDFMRDMMADDENDGAETQKARTDTGSARPAMHADVSPSHPTASATTTKLHMKPKPGVVGTGMLGVIGSPAQENDQAGNQSEDGAIGDGVAESKTQAGKSRAVRMARLAEPAALNACQSVVKLLERADRPLGFLGDRVRLFLGWVALATLATAIIVYLVSLF